MMYDEAAILTLCLEAGLVTQEQVDEAVKMSGIDLHPGQMLIVAGYISPHELQAAIDAESMVRSRRIHPNQARNFLKIACETEMTFCDVVKNQLADGGGDGQRETNNTE